MYVQKEPARLVRIVGQAPLQATIYELERLRCSLCGQVFTAPEPEGIGAEKYDETAAAMIAQLKYGSGTPFYRLAQLEQRMGIPLPASTQWELIEEAAEVLKPARDELIRQAAQGELMHNDDTSMRVLQMQRPEGDKRSGVFTSGIVSAPAIGAAGGVRIALYFTGREHAGENLTAVLAQRAAGLPPVVQMCDALSRNSPKLGEGVELLLANCWRKSLKRILAHGRRQFVEIVGSFPAECRFVLESLGKVYGNDAAARQQGLNPEQRLQFHRQHSSPIMTALEKWMETQITGRIVEPNSSLGKAIVYMQRHWKPLTLFLRQAGAPLDNNVCERAIKKAVLNRKNALFYKTMNGAEVGDLLAQELKAHFMTLIHTCELNAVNSFDYLVAMLRNPKAVAQSPADWMPWSFQLAAG